MPPQGNLASLQPPRKQAKQIIGACIRVLRLQARLTLDQLATKASVSYQYLLTDFMKDGQRNALVAGIVCAAISNSSSYRPLADEGCRLRREGRTGPPTLLQVDAQQHGDFRLRSAGGGGWHFVAVYEVDGVGDVRIVQVMVAELQEHAGALGDWDQTEAEAEAAGSDGPLLANRCGMTKLVDGTAYITAPLPSALRAMEHRRPGDRAPAWSVLAKA